MFSKYNIEFIGSLATNIQITTKARPSLFGATPAESTLHKLYSTTTEQVFMVNPRTKEIELYITPNQFEQELARLTNQYKTEQIQIAKELKEGEESLNAKVNKPSTPTPCNLVSFRPADYYAAKATNSANSKNVTNSNNATIAFDPYLALQELRRKYLTKPLDVALGIVEESEAYSCQPEFYVSGQKVTKQEAIEAQKADSNTQVDVYTAKNKVTVEKGLEDEGFLKDLDDKALQEYKEVKKELAEYVKRNSNQQLKNNDSRLNKAMEALKMDPTLNRDTLLSRVKDPEFRKLINEQYRDTSIIGNGSTADAKRLEDITQSTVEGKMHTEKVRGFLNRIKNDKIDKSSFYYRLNPDEKAVLNEIVSDYQDALNKK